MDDQMETWFPRAVAFVQVVAALAATADGWLPRLMELIK